MLLADVVMAQAEISSVMKLIYLLSALILCCIAIYLFRRSANADTTNISSINQEIVKPKEKKNDENIYHLLRNQALSATPAQLRLNVDNTSPTVYGIVMDYDLGPAIATVTAFKTGDASLYLSTGQVFIGGHDRENINKAGLAFVNQAQDYLSKAKPTELATLPDKECVKFYLLTNKGKYFYQETVASIENKTSEWTRLFFLGNRTITEYRLADENKN